jgi:hypothetical protein
MKTSRSFAALLAGAVGKLANLSVLDDDPTADIGNSKRIHAVWHRGKQAAGPVEMFTP